MKQQGTVTATAVKSEQADTEGGNWWVLVAIGTGSFMSGLDSSISNTVLPVISRALQADVAAVEWVVAIYLLVLSGLVLIFGRLSNRPGIDVSTWAGSDCSCSGWARAPLRHPSNGSSRSERCRGLARRC